MSEHESEGTGEGSEVAPGEEGVVEGDGSGEALPEIEETVAAPAEDEEPGETAAESSES